MATNPKVKQYDLTSEELDKQMQDIFGDKSDQDILVTCEESVTDFQPGTILNGKVLNILSDDVLIDVGYKSEGVIPLAEFEKGEEVNPGDAVEVLLEAVEDDSGLIVISKRKADRIRGWEKVVREHREGDVVSGRVMRKIKGGLLVDIGVPVFLPASQVDIRRPADIANYIGDTIECKILKIDESRRNIVVSRRRLLEEEREKQKEKLMAEIEIGQIRKGEVKNITDFGAFVDLGGIDGLLHITDMSWGRVSHPSEIVAIDEEIEVVILNINREEEKIALGLKQKSASPWKDVEEKYPVGSRVRGTVVNIMPYGAFVKLEEGIEGLVHISEMSWTRRINHPTEVVAIGDVIEVAVLGINKDKEEISLGMKQIEANPWTQVEAKYPPGTVIRGRVRNLTNYGAFVEIEEGIDGLLHVSDMSWTRKVGHPSEILKKSDEVEVVVLSVDQDRKRVALGMKQLEDDPWDGTIQEIFQSGDVVAGTVTKLTNFGIFVELQNNLEGLLHVSEIAEQEIPHPEEVIREGDHLAVKILRVDPDERKIGLSLKRVTFEERAKIEGALDLDERLAAGAGEAPVATEGEEPPAEAQVQPSETEAPDAADAEQAQEQPSEAEASQPQASPESEEPSAEAPVEAPAAEENTETEADKAPAQAQAPTVPDTQVEPEKPQEAAEESPEDDQPAPQDA
ncbi:MAG: 30S ribosomal protein S1 [Planctomycetes bacterium]|nr:30S ribosomal protein S1 [Planctomycetota bacterium]